MRTRRPGGYLRWAGWWFMLAAVLAGCERGGDGGQPTVAQDTSSTPDPLPGVSVGEASAEQLMTACRNLILAPDVFAAETTLGNGSRVRITPAAGNHNIKPADLADGRMTARIDVKSGPGIPGYGMGPADTACTLIVGPNYGALETIFISYRDGQRLDTVPTAVIHKARPHGHPEADWIVIEGLSLLTGAIKRQGGMIPWLLQGNQIWAAQSGCGRYRCCLQAQPE